MTPAEAGRAMRLDDRGRCPVCEIKPLRYKRERIFACHRCSREYNITTGIQQSNWAWKLKDGIFVPTYPTHDYVTAGSPNSSACT